MMTNPIKFGIMKNGMQKSRYETPEAELLELVTEDFVLYPQIDSGTEFEDEDY